MRDLGYPGTAGELDTALRLVQSELPAADENLQSALALGVWATWQLVAAIDRHPARPVD